MKTDLEISLPTDSGGFITRECPECRKKFKVKYSEAKKEESSKPLSFCPYCGFRGDNCFWTDEQVEYIKKIAVSKVVGPMLDQFGKQLENTSNNFLKIESFTKYPKHAIVPKESEDLRKFSFDCCKETIKILENWDSNLFCIICGKEVEFNGWR